MPLEEIKKLLAARIFRRFRLHVTDGSHHDVTESAQCLPEARSLYISAPDNHPGGGTHWVRVAVIHITKLEPLDFSTEPSGNGVAHP